jgi:phosphate transport system permease protein
MTRKLKDIVFKWIFKIASILSLFVLIGIILMLFIRGLRTFTTITLAEFFTTNEWIPSAYSDPKFGILSLVVSSLMVTAGALVIAIPIGIGTAVYLAEFASKRVARVIKPAIEILAGIPSVTIGFLGIVLVGPLIANLFDTTNGLNALNASILLGIMALPTIISISEDALYSVPKSYKEASYALGVNRWDTMIRVVIPASSSGIIAAIMLGMGRVIGETMAVLMVAGNAVAMPEGFLSPIRPLTATIAIEMGEVPYGSTHYFALFELGVILFLITLAINLISDRLTKRIKKG